MADNAGDAVSLHEDVPGRLQSRSSPRPVHQRDVQHTVTLPSDQVVMPPLGGQAFFGKFMEPCAGMVRAEGGI
jgi:hypothetical protein